MTPLPKSISFHIGAHKTASSHLQNTLYRNREMISDAGIRVYGPGYLRMKGRNLAAMFGLSWSESPPPRRNPHDQLRFLAKGRKRLVFSEENFVGNLADSKGRTPLPIYPSGAERVAEIVAKWAPVRTRLFVAVRNPASFLASAYSQALMGGVNVDPQTYRQLNDWRLIDWASYVDDLRVIPGLEMVYVWRQEDYDQSQRRLLRRMLRWRLGVTVQPAKGRINRSLSETAVQQALDWAKEGKTGQLARDARKAFPIGPTEKKFILYGASDRAQADTVYQQQMARIEQMDGVTVL